jgi:hypothetical protein
LYGETAGAPAILPTKRFKPADGNAATTPGGGFRIDGRRSWADEPETAASGTGLEVSEINGHIPRLMPEIQPVERVPRAPVTFQPRAADAESRRRRSADLAGEWGLPNRHALLWVLGAGGVISLLVVGAMAMLPRVNRANAVQHRPGQMELVIEQDDFGDGPAQLSKMLRRQDEAGRVFDEVATATGLEELLPLLREPEVVRSLIERDGKIGSGQRHRQGASWTAKEQDGLVYGVLEGTLEDFSEFKAYFVEEGDLLRMDWKASHAYGSASFSDLQQGRGDASEIRGWLARMDYYSIPFPEDRYQSYRLVSPDQLETVWVYAERGSDVNDALNRHFKGGQILQGNPDDGKMTVRLARGPQEAMPNQWLLVELLHKEWIAP